MLGRMVVEAVSVLMVRAILSPLACSALAELTLPLLDQAGVV